MPKDKEVDEKVMPVAWIVTNGGESCEPWLEYEQSEVDALPAVCIAEPLYSAATVAELRAEVADLRARLVKQRRELGAEADQADAEAKRITEVAERAMNLLERLDPVEFQKFCKSEFNRLTGADPT